MMSLGEILFVYRARMRESSLLLQEALAVLGIAVGVALLFASQVASTSLDGSVRALASQVVGSTQFQLDSRGTEGFNAQLARTVERLPGVEMALPLLDHHRPARLGFDLSSRRRSTVRALQRGATAALHRQAA